jgi:hypothetical protein
MASVDEADAEGYRRFRWSCWIPDVYCSALSWGMKTEGKNHYVELNQIGFSVSADPLSIPPDMVKEA